MPRPKPPPPEFDPITEEEFGDAVADVLFGNPQGRPKYAEQEHINTDLRVRRKLVRRAKPRKG